MYTMCSLKAKGTSLYEDRMCGRQPKRRAVYVFTCWLHQNQADTEIEYKTQRLKII